MYIDKRIAAVKLVKAKKADTETDKLDSLRDFSEKRVKRAKLRLELGLGLADVWVDEAEQEQRGMVNCSTQNRGEAGKTTEK